MASDLIWISNLVDQRSVQLASITEIPEPCVLALVHKVDISRLAYVRTKP
jgi:hypothetical protein